MTMFCAGAMSQIQPMRSEETLIDWLSQHGLEDLHGTLVAEDFTKVEHLLDLEPANISNLRFVIPDLKGEGRAG